LQPGNSLHYRPKSLQSANVLPPLDNGRALKTAPSSVQKTACSSTQKTGVSGCRKLHAEHAEKCTQVRVQKNAPGIKTKKSLSLNKDELNKDASGGEGIDSSERQRPEPERPAPATVLPRSKPQRPDLTPLSEYPGHATAVERARRFNTEAQRRASEPVEPSPPTPGQLAWLATLSPERRAKFDTLHATTQASLLGPHTHGFNPCRVLEAHAQQVLTPRPALPPMPIPETTAEILENLPGAPPDWPLHAAESIVRDFGTGKDRRLWPGFVRVMTAVRDGSFPASAVLDAHRQAMKPGCKKPGAVFNTALQRDHGWRWADG